MSKLLPQRIDRQSTDAMPPASAPSSQTGKLPRPFFALARNAAAVTEAEQAVFVSVDAARHFQNLEADGCAFSCALDWLATLAGFDEVPRSFIRGVAGAIERDKQGKGKETPIPDERLAELMNCHVKTIQRQRKAYLKQEQELNFSVLKITEGEYDQKKKKNGTTRYQFLIGNQAAQVVEQARTSPLWARDQFEAIREAAKEVFGDITEAPLAGRKRGKRERTPESKAKQLRAMIVSLAANLTDEVLKIEDPQAKANLRLDTLLDDIETAMRGGDLNQVLLNKGFNHRGSKMSTSPLTDEPVLTEEEEVRTRPPETGEIETERIPPAVEARTEVIEPEPPEIEHHCDDPDIFTEPEFFDDSPPDDLPEETENERAEREAIEAEGCGQLPRYEIGAKLFPVTSTGVPLHDEPSPIAQIRPSSDGWQYLLEGFSIWRDEAHLIE
jgi:hypothetical protein